MIKLRLQRKGRKKRPFYHVVVADSRSPRDGRVIERLGRYDNVSENKQVLLDEARVMHWLKIGAQPTDTVRNLLKNQGILYKMHLMMWGKSEEEIETALADWREKRDAKMKSRLVSRKEKMVEVLEAEAKQFKDAVSQKAKKAAAELKAEKEADAVAEAAEAAAAAEGAEAPAEAETAVEAPAAEAAPEASEASPEAPSEPAAEEAPVAEAEAPAAEAETPVAETASEATAEAAPESAPEAAPAEEEKKEGSSDAS